MNSFLAIAVLSLASYCCAEVPAAETKMGEERQIFIPLPFIPLPNRPTNAPPAATTTVAPGGGSGGTCPGRCCKTYCLAGDFCTAAVAPAAPTCTPTSTPKKCLNSEAAGCTGCTPSTSCQNECGTVMNISPIAICP